MARVHGSSTLSSTSSTPHLIRVMFTHFLLAFSEDMYAQDSIDLLTRSGIEFKRHEQNGIDVSHFGELLMSSGIVLSDNIKWITFHSGYDFGYLYGQAVSMLACLPSID